MKIDVLLIVADGGKVWPNRRFCDNVVEKVVKILNQNRVHPAPSKLITYNMLLLLIRNKVAFDITAITASHRMLVTIYHPK